MISELEIILLISSIGWSIQHILTVLPRVCIIKLTNEIFYTYLRITFNTIWYSINVILYCIIFFQIDQGDEDKVLYEGVGIIALIVRILSVYLLILCLMVAPSQFDIASQRNQNRRELQQTLDVDTDNEMEEREKRESQTCCSTKLVYISANNSDQVAVYGLSHITRHPMLIGFVFYFLSFLLHDVLIIDIFFYVPQIVQIVVGILHQEYRMKQEKRYNYYFEHTSIIPLVAMIKGKTTIHWNEAKRLLLSLLIITILMLLIIGIVFIWFGKDTIINEINNHIQGGITIIMYIVLLIVLDIVAICTGKYYRAT